MRWPWQPRTVPSGRSGAPVARPVEVEADDLLTCSGCGGPLGFDPDDEPDGEGPGLHICGACNRARNFDAMLEGEEPG